MKPKKGVWINFFAFKTPFVTRKINFADLQIYMGSFLLISKLDNADAFIFQFFYVEDMIMKKCKLQFLIRIKE